MKQNTVKKGLINCQKIKIIDSFINLLRSKIFEL